MESSLNAPANVSSRSAFGGIEGIRECLRVAECGMIQTSSEVIS